MYGVRIACVYVEDLLQWVPLSQVSNIKFYMYEGKNCAEFTLENKTLRSYVEYKEL